MARIGLETNSSGEVSLGKEIAPLLQCFAVMYLRLLSSKEFSVTKIKSGFTQVAYCMENIFLKLFARSQSRDINGMSLNPFTWR